LTSKIKRALELDYLILKPSLRTYSNKYKFLHEKILFINSPLSNGRAFLCLECIAILTQIT
jgi:hypothetical protein